jgi:type VI secretion system secreted protein Hcp
MEEVSFTYRKVMWRWEPDGVESEDDWRAPKS